MLNTLLTRGAMLLDTAAQAFVWNAHMREIIITCLLSMVPTYEGRYAVPLMLRMGMPTFWAFLLAVVFSTLPMPFILLLLRPVLDWFYTLPIKPVRKFAAWLERRSEKKRAKMNADSGRGLRGRLKGKVSEETIELIGLYIFVALPLPGTGAWTGSAIATLFEMNRLKAALAILLGNITAVGIMTAMACGLFSII